MNEYDFNVFTANGKLNRWQFILLLCILEIPRIIYRIYYAGEVPMPFGGYMSAIIGLISACYWSTMACAKRLRDCGLSRKLALINLIPYVKIIFQIILMLIPSKKEDEEL